MAHSRDKGKKEKRKKPKEKEQERRGPNTAPRAHREGDQTTRQIADHLEDVTRSKT